MQQNANSWILRTALHKIDGHRLTAGSELVSVLPESIQVNGGTFHMQYHRLSGGLSEDLSCLMIDTGPLSTCILPDRGMGIWKSWAGDMECGWQSPVAGPIHPKWVPVQDSSGLGWLEGFDELLVRCGLLSNGAPEFTETRTVKYPLHGRIANLPAHQLEVHADPQNGTLDVVGIVRESRFLIYSLELQTRYRFRAGSSTIEVTDTVTNRSSVPGSMQMLYHINIGQPILQSGAMVHAAYRSITPRDPRAKAGFDHWNHCDGPSSGYAEQVYYIVPMANDQHWTESMIASPDGARGYSVQFDTRTLPFLNVWKNTVAVEDGYVVGLEPATGYPNTRSVEEQSGRVVNLAGGEARTFRLKLLALNGRDEVKQAQTRIQALQMTPGIQASESFHK